MRTTLTKVGTKLDLNLTVANPNDSPLTTLELRALRIDRTVVVSTKTALGRVDPFTTFAKTFTVAMPAKLGPSPMVRYEIRYEEGPYDSGMTSGVNPIPVK